METAPASNRSWTKSFALLGMVFLVVFGIFIFSDLKQRPMHNDEAVNAFFFEKLLKENSYRYNPDNYHGPFLYYIQLPVTWLSPQGISPTSIRAGVAAASVLLLAMLLFAKRRIGRWGALTALLMLGSSCGFLFYARYFIHEIYFILFTLGLYLSAVTFRDTRRPVYFYAGCAAASLLFATKETSVVVFAVLALSAVVVDARGLTEELLTWVRALRYHLLGGLVLAVAIWALFYSSFFSNAQGLLDSFRAYLSWTKTGLSSGHNKPFPYFIQEILVPYESPLVFLSLVGAVAAYKTQEKSGLFLLCWSAGILLAHSLIPYKTPWLTLNFLLPMALLGGYGLQTIVDQIQQRRDAPVFMSILVFVLVGTSIFLIRQFPRTMWMMYVEYDNESYPYIYVPSSRDVYRLRNDIDELARKSGFGKDVPINIVTPIEWPLPFYLRDYPHAMFWRSFDGVKYLPTPLIIAEKEQHDGLAEKLKGIRYVVKPYLLRNAVVIELWAQEKLAGE